MGRVWAQMRGVPGSLNQRFAEVYFDPDPQRVSNDRLEMEGNRVRIYEHNLNTNRRPKDPKGIQFVGKAAQLPKQRFHDLRHACISLLAAQGVQPKVIAEIVGHSDIRLTQNVYQHVYEDAKRDAAHRMDELLTNIADVLGTPVATKVATKIDHGRPI